MLAERVRAYITRHNIQLVGITGSWGLALTKRALEVLLADYVTLRVGRDGAHTSIQVLADVLGVPREGILGMLGVSKIREIFDSEPQVILTEVPLRMPGDIDWIAQELLFTYAAVTNVHSSYEELFNRKELIAHELLSLPASLKENQVAVLNLDDALLASFADNIQASVTGYGQTPASDVRILRVHTSLSKGATLALEVEGKQLEGMFPHLHTTLQVQSCVAAFALWYEMVGEKKNIEQAFRALQRVAPPHGYGSKHVIDGIQVYNNAGDATPESVLADLHTMSRASGRLIAILGDITHLGGEANAWHTQIGEEVAQAADIFIGVGDAMRVAQTAALKCEHPVDTHHFMSARNVGKWLHGYLRKGDTVYLAGSREMRMQSIIQRLQHGS